MGKSWSQNDETNPWRLHGVYDAESPPKTRITSKQIETTDGMYVWEIDDMVLLKRFLILGSDCTYNATEKEPARKHLHCLDNLLKAGRGKEVVQLLLEFSKRGSAPRQKYLIQALAVCAKSNDEETKKLAYGFILEICRIPTHLFLFLHYCKQESGEGGIPKGWGRAHRRAVIKWYQDKCKSPMSIARLLTKYKSRKMSSKNETIERWSHKDVFSLAHPSGNTDDVMKVMLRYVMQGFQEAQKLVQEMGINDDKILKMLSYLEAVEEAKKCTDEDALVQLIKNHKLEREHVPTQMMRSKKVCEALVMNMGIEAKLRNLCMISAKGICYNKSEVEDEIVKTLADHQKIIDARVHPFRIMLAIISYERREGMDKTKSKNGMQATLKLEWEINKKVLDALYTAFDSSFTNVKPSGKRFLLAINLSDRMRVPCVGCSAMRCDQAAAVMVMTTIRSEKKCKVLAFSDEVLRLKIEKNDTFSKIQRKMEEAGNKLKTDTTDCALPMLWAKENKKEIDVFIVYTDNAPTCGKMHASEALKKYREESEVPNAKLIVVAMASNEYTIAEPDCEMLNIVGFDTNAPTIIANFSQS